MDEKLLTQCPACGLQLEVKLAWIGRSGTCKCGEKFYIEPSMALKETPREADAGEQGDTPVHVVDAADIFGADDMSPEENFRRTIRLALQDDMVSIDEQILLENLRHEYGISPELARQIFNEEKGEPAAADEEPVSESPAGEEPETPAETEEPDVAEEVAEAEEEEVEATSWGSGLLWVGLGAAAAVGAYFLFF
jgi:hypothetical protein